MTTGRREELEEALAEVQRTQTAFWDALRQLEALSGRDLDSTVDFAGYAIVLDTMTDEEVASLEETSSKEEQ